MPDHPPDEFAHERRHESEAFGVWLGRRHYPLSHIGKGLVMFGTVFGIVAGCVTGVMAVAGKRVADTSDETLAQVRDTASAAFGQGRRNQFKLDSMAASVSTRVSRLEDAVQMLAELKCKELASERAPYLPPTCTKILREER